MKLLGIDSNNGSRFYRMIPMLKHMAKVGHEIKLIHHNNPDMDAYIAWSDVVIIEMLFSADTVRDIKKQGKKVILEIDDLLHTVPKTHYGYEETKGWGKIKWLWRVYTTVRLCDGLIATTKDLDKLYGWIAPKSLVFSNYIHLEHWLKESKKNLDPNKIRLLWAGSTSHVGDLNWVRPIIHTIIRKYPQVQFVYVGMGGAASDDLYTQFIYGEDFFTELPKDRRESILPYYPEVWPYILASLQADIAIAPLEKNYFNKHKSICKFLEYSINEIPGVYSRWHYTNVKDGITGFTADTKEEWVDKLSLLIENKMLRLDMGRNAKQDVLNNHVASQHLQRWQNFVEKIGSTGKGKLNESSDPSFASAS